MENAFKGPYRENGLTEFNELKNIELLREIQKNLVARLRQIVEHSPFKQKLEILKKNTHSVRGKKFTVVPYSENIANDVVAVDNLDDESDQLLPQVRVSISDLIRPVITKGAYGGPDAVVSFSPGKKGKEICVYFERPGLAKGPVFYALQDSEIFISDMLAFVTNTIEAFPNAALGAR